MTAPQCAICLEDTYDNEDRRPGVGPCGHMFHCHCIQGWLRKKSTCPVCKASTTKSKIVKLYWNVEEQLPQEPEEMSLLGDGDDPIKVATESLKREKKLRERLGNAEKKFEGLGEECQQLQEQLESQIEANDRVKANAAEQGRNARRMLADIDKAQIENQNLKKKLKETQGEYTKIQSDQVAYHYIANVLEQENHDSLDHLLRTHTTEQVVNIQAKALTWRTKVYRDLSDQVKQMKRDQGHELTQKMRQAETEHDSLQNKYEDRLKECTELKHRMKQMQQEQDSQQSRQQEQSPPHAKALSQHTQREAGATQRQKIVIAKTNHTIGGQPSMKCLKSASLMQRVNNTGVLASSGSFIRQARNACGGFVKVLNVGEAPSRGLKRGAQKLSQGGPAKKLSRVDQFFAPKG